MFFERKEGWGEAKEHIYLKFANMKRTIVIFAALVMIKADCDSLSRPLSFVDIVSEDKKVNHVHNVVDPSLPESRTVNAGMIDFMNDCLLVTRAK
jgi:hypothetical protein